MTRQVLVVGAGLAGLATAIGLRQAGVDVEIVERARELTEIGAAISIWPNALAACDQLGLAQAISAAGSPELHGGVRVAEGRWIARADRSLVGRYLGGPSVLLHRAELQAILLEAAVGIPLHLATRCVGVVDDAADVGVKTADGSVLRADAAIGCDGIWSTVRATIGDESNPVYSGLACWRAVIDNPGSVTESWISAGGGNQFLAAPMSQDRLYLATAIPMERGRAALIADAPRFFAEVFDGWHEPIEDLVNATASSAWVAADIFSRPPPRWLARSKVALAGDAAHPMTPDLGQGGCQGIEDAAILGRCFSTCADVGTALRRYEARRLRRVRSVVSASARIGRAMSTSSRLEATARDATLRLAPNPLRMRYLARFAARAAFDEAS